MLVTSLRMFKPKLYDARYKSRSQDLFETQFPFSGDCSGTIRLSCNRIVQKHRKLTNSIGRLLLDDQAAPRRILLLRASQGRRRRTQARSSGYPAIVGLAMIRSNFSFGARTSLIVPRRASISSETPPRTAFDLTQLTADFELSKATTVAPCKAALTPKAPLPANASNTRSSDLKSITLNNSGDAFVNVGQKMPLSIVRWANPKVHSYGYGISCFLSSAWTGLNISHIVARQTTNLRGL